MVIEAKFVPKNAKKKLSNHWRTVFAEDTYLDMVNRYVNNKAFAVMAAERAERCSRQGKEEYFEFG